MPEWDPEMLASHEAFLAEAAELPPIALQAPFDPQRAINDALAMTMAEGGPTMAESSDRWVAGRGRRILCRLHRPIDEPGLPVLVYFHGGGWVWASIDTHDRLTREYAAAGRCAVVSVDYALSPEAKFPQALEECAAVVRWIAAHGAEWGLDPARIALGGGGGGGRGDGKRGRGDRMRAWGGGRFSSPGKKSRALPCAASWRCIRCAMRIS